jgi:hypothetical protein
VIGRTLDDAGEQRVPPAGDQAQERRLEHAGLEEGGGDVALEMVDRHERQPPRGRERLGGRDPDEQRADEPRALRDRDAVEFVEGRARRG